MFRFLTTFTFIAAAVFSITLHGQALTVKVSKTKAAVGELIQLSYIMQGNATEFEPPNLRAFQVDEGPSQSQSVSIVNGVMSQSTTIYYIIRPKKEGTFTIKPIKAVVNNKTEESEKVVIEVTAAPQAIQQNSNVSPYSNSPRQYYNTPQNNSQVNPLNNTATPAVQATTSTRDYFITYSVDKTKAFIGEQIHLAVKLYTRFEARGPDDFQFPTTEGFWKYDAPKTTTVRSVRENIDGVNYSVYVIFENFLFPQKAGEITIEPTTMKCRILKPVEKTGNSWEDFMNFGLAREVPVTLSTQRLKINVEPLPETQTNNEFNGAVGEYTLKSELNRNRVNENDALNMRVTVNGRGNLKLIDPPKLEVSDNFEVYEPTSEENIEVGANGVNGSKTYDYTIVARNACTDTIPAINFTFFDDNAQKYVSLNTGSFPVTVDPADPSQQAEMVSNFAAKNSTGTAAVPELLRAIKTVPVAASPDHHVFGSLPFYIILLGVPLAFIGFLFFYRRKQKRDADVTGTRIRLAGKIARQRLAQAGDALAKNEPQRFYEELSKALYGYLAWKAGLQHSEFSQEGIKNILTGKQVSENTISSLVRLIGSAEFARYAPVASGESLQQQYEEAENCINALEKELQNK
jgi:hypothetical protein